MRVRDALGSPCRGDAPAPDRIPLRGRSGYARPMARITGAHTVLIEVSDLDRSLAFRRDGLGIPLAPYGEDEKNCHDAWIGGSLLLLHRDFSAATGRSKRAVGIHLHLSVDDADGFSGFSNVPFTTRLLWLMIAMTDVIPRRPTAFAGEAVVSRAKRVQRPAATELAEASG
jgi:hypothetical protein